MEWCAQREAQPERSWRRQETGSGGLVGLYRGFGVYDWMMECIRNRAGMVLQ